MLASTCDDIFVDNLTNLQRDFSQQRCRLPHRLAFAEPSRSLHRQRKRLEAPVSSFLPVESVGIEDSTPIKSYKPTEGKSRCDEEKESDIANVPQRRCPGYYTGDPYGRGDTHQREADRNVIQPEVEKEEESGP